MVYGETLPGWGGGVDSGFIKYRIKALIALRRGLNFLLLPLQPKLSFLSLIIS